MFAFAVTWMWPIVSGIFFSIGVNSLPHALKFRKTARKIRGRIKAIEKYRSSSGSGSDRTTHTYYRPIVEYTYNDQTYVITDAGTSRFSYKIGQHVDLLLNVSKDNKTVTAVLDNWNYLLFDALLIGMTVFFFFLYVFAMNGSIILISMVFITLTILGHFFFKKNGKTKEFITIDTSWEPAKDSIIIKTEKDYLKEISSHKRMNNIGGILGIIIGFSCLYFGFTGLSSADQTILFSDFGTIIEDLRNGQLAGYWKKSLILIGFGLYCIICCTLGLLQSRKKYDTLLQK